jgi:hypothetical protein
MRRKISTASHLHQLSSLPSPLPPLFSFFRIIMTFLAEFRCYIGSQTLALWPTTLGPDAVAYDVRSGPRSGPTPGRSYRRRPRRYVPYTVGHGGRCIFLKNLWPTIYFCKIMINKYKKIAHTSLVGYWGPQTRPSLVRARSPHCAAGPLRDGAGRG